MKIPHRLMSLIATVRRVTPVHCVLLAAALMVTGCADQVVDPDVAQAPEDPLFKKCPSPPCGGGGEDPGTPPNPVIAFDDIWTLFVMDEDGSNRVAVFSDGEPDAVRNPSWAPDGDGTTESPWRLVFWRAATYPTSLLATLDIDTVGGTVNSGIPQALDIPYPVTDGPEWGANGEIAYVTEVLVPATGLLHEAIYVIPDPALGDPTPIEVYVAAGPSEADEHGVHSPVWSPWGNAIAFVEWRRTPGSSRENALRIVDRSTGAVTTAFDYGQFQGSGNGLDWSQTPSNPSFLAFVEEKPKKNHGATLVVHKLQLTDPAGNYIIEGESSLLATGFGDPTWSSDDSRLLVTDYRYVKTLDVQTGAVLETLTRHVATKLDWRR